MIRISVKVLGLDLITDSFIRSTENNQNIYNHFLNSLEGLSWKYCSTQIALSSAKNNKISTLQFYHPIKSVIDFAIVIKRGGSNSLMHYQATCNLY